jgi:hypothetical protein
MPQASDHPKKLSASTQDLTRPLPTTPETLCGRESKLTLMGSSDAATFWDQHGRSIVGNDACGAVTRSGAQLFRLTSPAGFVTGRVLRDAWTFIPRVPAALSVRVPPTGFCSTRSDSRSPTNYSSTTTFGAEEIAFSIWAHVHGMAVLETTHLRGFDVDFAAYHPEALRRLVRGFTTEPN